MKYVIEWHPRAGGSSAENLATTKRSLEVLAKWTPGGTMHQLLFRVDGGGGFSVVEADDPGFASQRGRNFRVQKKYPCVWHRTV